MRALIPLLALLFAGNLQAQLINGSFEIDGTPSLEAWEWTCGDPEPANDGAPGAGSWSATKQPGHAKGCFPSYLYQRLPNAHDGDIVQLSAWVKCPDFGVCQGGFLGLGRISNGEIELEENVSAQDTEWTFLSFSDTMEIGPQDTAIVVLHAGFIGGPVSSLGSYFDGVAVEFPLTTREWQGDLLFVQQSPDGHSLAVHAGVGERIQLSDATGRVLSSTIGTASGWRTIRIPDGQAWIVVTVIGANTQRSQRIVVR